MTQTQIAALAGVDQTGVSRWLHGSNVPRAESVIKLARALRRSPIEALLAAGHLSIEEVGLKPDLKPSTRELSNDQVIAEIRRRITERG
jgi:transcriptional regulator with XRE-family HTH domain